MSTLKTPKAQFSETEAAAILGMPIDEFRSFVRHHIGEGADDPLEDAATCQRSDLLVLRLIAGKQLQLGMAG